MHGQGSRDFRWVGNATTEAVLRKDRATHSSLKWHGADIVEWQEAKKQLGPD